MAKKYRGPPATIAGLRTNGVTGARVRCTREGCHRLTIVAFDAMGLSEAMPFPLIATAKRWVCSGCGGRAVEVMPDWPDPRAGPRRW